MSGCVVCIYVVVWCVYVIVCVVCVRFCVCVCVYVWCVICVCVFEVLFRDYGVRFCRCAWLVCGFCVCMCVYCGCVFVVCVFVVYVCVGMRCVCGDFIILLECVFFIVFFVFVCVF